jgi:prolyl oligopeptidase
MNIAFADAPVAPVRPVVSDYHGQKIADPYRYFEDTNNPEVQNWIKAQASYADQTLRAIPGREKLLARIQELDEGAAYKISRPQAHGGDIYYLKLPASENVAKLYVRNRARGEFLLVDPQQLSRSPEEHHTISFYQPSPDGKLVLYGTAASGGEQTVLRIVEVESAKQLPLEIDRLEAEYTPPYWLPDGSGFVYSRRRKLPPDAPSTEGYKRTQAFLHRLEGTAAGTADSDRVIFARDVTRDVPMEEIDFPSVIITPGSDWAVGKIKHGDSPQLTIYATPLSSLDTADIHWTKICDVADGVTDFAIHADDIYLLTSADAPRFRVARTLLRSPDFNRAEEIVPAGDAVVQSIDTADTGLFVGQLADGASRIVRVGYDKNDRLQKVRLPEGFSSAHVVSATPLTAPLIVTSAWTKGSAIYRYSSADGLIDTRLQPRGKFDDLNEYESVEVLAPARDGAKIPLSILCKRGLKLDGQRPTLITGYGGYGFTLNARFDPTNIAWLERGGVLAVAHVRGGGEYGDEWRIGGRQATKPNTWRDFIDCCEYLIKEGYTNPKKLAGEGTSAGGILVGRAITERPDLFAAALVNVGCLDMLRSETTMNGVPNIAEFGSVATKEGFDGLLAMSAYHNVKDGVAYPAALLTHGINDPRVEPWHSAKMTARLQAATSSGKPVLLRVDYQAGHGIGSTKKQEQELQADQWAFLLSQMGEEL